MVVIMIENIVYFIFAAAVAVLTASSILGGAL
jgi:hypothetical protein